MQMECENVANQESQHRTHKCFKRQRVDEENLDIENGIANLTTVDNPFYGRSFVPIKATQNTFHSEEVKPKGHTMYLPLKDDTLLNVKSCDQITFTSGTFFIGDSKGAFVRNSQGHSINLWRFDEKTKKLFISRGILFTNQTEYWTVRKVLEYL